MNIFSVFAPVFYVDIVLVKEADMCHQQNQQKVSCVIAKVIFITRTFVKF